MNAQTRDDAYCPKCDRSYGIAGATCPHDGTRLIRLGKDPMLDRTLDGRFVIREQIGEGGMGVVYRAWQESVRRDVALKVMRYRTGVDQVVARRFLREAQLASQLAHPATVAVIDFGATEDNTLFLVMELLRGVTLDRILDRGEPLGVGRACRIALQLADALEAAHGHDIIHRDLKPGNVMVLDEPLGKDAIKVLDFGLAKVMHEAETITLGDNTEGVLGTPTYMAPEMATGADLDARADLYAVGVILYEMLAGQPPFVTTSVAQMIALHATAMPPALGPDVPPQLAVLVGNLLAKDPDQRIANATELRMALESIIAELGPEPRRFAIGTARLVPDGEPARASSQGEAAGEVVVDPTRVPSRRRARLAAAGATVALVGAVAAGSIAPPSGPAVGADLEGATTIPTTAPTEPTAPVPSAPVASAVVPLPIVSVPSGAIVEVDGVARGLAPLTVDVRRGANVAIRVSLKGFRPRTLQVRADDATPIQVELTRTPIRPFVKP